MTYLTNLGLGFHTHTSLRAVSRRSGEAAVPSASWKSVTEKPSWKSSPKQRHGNTSWNASRNFILTTM